MLYSGIDLHKNNCFITTINANGDIISQMKLPNDPTKLTQYFRLSSESQKAVIETTAGWYWLSDLLVGNGVEVVLAHAKYLKAISYAKVKPDKIDLQTLAQLLRMDYIPVAHKISPQLRGLRDTFRMRLRFVERRTAVYNSIHRIGEKFNCDDGIDWDQGVIPDTIPESFKLQLLCLFEHITLFNTHITKLETHLHPYLIPNEDVQRLLEIPAFGKITAFSVYLEIDDIDRFPDDRHFASYCRLVPGANNSNQTHRHRSGSKDGNRYLKISFTDASVHAIRYYSEYKTLYQKIKRRSNEAIARTVVAKELSRICFFVLKNKTSYKGLKGQTPSRQKALVWPRLASPLFGRAD